MTQFDETLLNSITILVSIFGEVERIFPMKIFYNSINCIENVKMSLKKYLNEFLKSTKKSVSFMISFFNIFSCNYVTKNTPQKLLPQLSFGAFVCERYLS